MLDIKLIREKPELVRENLKRRRNPELVKMLEQLIKQDKEWRGLISEANELRQKRNEISIKVAEAKKSKKDTTKLLNEAKKIPEEIKRIEAKTNELDDSNRLLLSKIPNLLHDSVPYGKDDNDNVEIRRWGKQPKFDFEPKSHLEILENLGMIDTENAAKVAGNLFFFLKGPVVLLDLALQRFAIDFLVKKGFQLLEPPFMVNKRTYEGMIGNPFDFAEASYKIEGEDLYLIPTSEYPMGGMFMDRILNKGELPLRLCGVSACFRKEVGTHGKYSKGLFRMHQFNKVEQFVVCLPEESWSILEELQRNCEELYQRLGLHYRVVNICTGDIGVKAAKRYDTEVWMADGKFREVGSNSNCTNYQARTLNIKYREKEGQSPIGFVHTLNNTALATSRTMLATLEQFQQKDGSVLIPKVLRPFMNGIERLT